jgi:hypothetical protein
VPDRIAAPAIAVAADGRVTMHVDQQPLDWVLEQLALQTGYGDLRERVRPPLSAAGPQPGGGAGWVQAGELVCVEAPAIAAPDIRGWLSAIERGSEAERLDGLAAAASRGVQLPDEVLRSVLETDASDRVRLAALEQYLQPRSGDAVALRSALETALYVPNAAIQQEVRRRLDEIDAVEPDADTSGPQEDSQ